MSRGLRTVLAAAAVATALGAGTAAGPAPAAQAAQASTTDRETATKRVYQFTGNVLRLPTPPTRNAAGEVQSSHLYWERMPAIE